MRRVSMPGRAGRLPEGPVITAEAIPNVQQGTGGLRLMEEYCTGIDCARTLLVDGEVASERLGQQGMLTNIRIGGDPKNRTICPLPLSNDEPDLGNAARRGRNIRGCSLDDAVETQPLQSGCQLGGPLINGK